MSRIGIDTSNYTGSPDARWDALAQQVALCAPQAINPPPGYPPGVTRAQVQWSLDHELLTVPYVWKWFGTGIQDIQRRLDLLTPFTGQIDHLALDVEDTNVGALRGAQQMLPPIPPEALARIKRQPPPERRELALLLLSGLSLQGRIDELSQALELCNQFPTKSGLPPSVYSAAWFWNPYMGGTTVFNSYPGWGAIYDGQADPNVWTPYGGWLRLVMKQYAGTSTLAGVGNLDLNVLADDYLVARPVTPVHAGAGVNVDPLNPAGRPLPADLKALGVAWVRLVSRRGVESYVYDCQVAGLKVLAVVAKESGGYVFGGPEIWQIGNEPDASGPASWTMTPDEYVQQWALYRGTYPDLVMVGAGLASGDPGWWRQVAGRLQGCSGVAVHPYGKIADQAAVLLDQYRQITPTVLVTEWNRHADEIGAYAAMLDSRAAGGWWFCHSDAMVNGFGLVDVSGQPKPEYHALRAALTGTPVPGPTPTPTPTPDLKALADALEQAAAYLRRQAA